MYYLGQTRKVSVFMIEGRVLLCFEGIGRRVLCTVDWKSICGVGATESLSKIVEVTRRRSIKRCLVMTLGL